MAEYEHCPVCGKSLPENLEANFCPFCGVLIYQRDQQEAPAPGPQPLVQPAPETPRQKKQIPWENQPELGFLQRLTQTWSESIFNPTDFFKRMPVTGGIGAALLYSLIFRLMGNAFMAFWQKAMFSYFEQALVSFPPEFANLFNVPIERQLLFAPISALFGIFIVSIVFHVSLLVLGASKNGYQATFRAVAYSDGIMLFYVIPVLGWIAGLVWSIVLLAIGFRESQETTTARALLAVFLPLLVCCGLIIFFAVMFATIFTQMGTGV